MRSIKRSRRIALVTMGVSAFALSACGNNSEKPVDVTIYESLEQCVAEKRLTESQCERAFEKAIDEHARVAQRYASFEDCEAAEGKGQCEPADRGTYRSGVRAFFIPVGGHGTPQPLYPPKPGAAGQPGQMGFRTADNAPVGSKAGPASLPAKTLASAGSKPVLGVARTVTGHPAATTVARSGFGGSSVMVSSGGSSAGS